MATRVIVCAILLQSSHKFIPPNIHNLVQDCSISSADALEILQSCTKPWYDDMQFISYLSYAIFDEVVFKMV